jgi:lipopolysaccharide biosynthesis regulator YciM
LKIRPLHLVIIAFVLLLVIVFLVPTYIIKPSQNEQTASNSKTDLLKTLSESAKTKIDSKWNNKISILENKLTNARSSDKMQILLDLQQTWDSAGSRIITAEYSRLYALESKIPVDYAIAGNLLVEAYRSAADSEVAVVLADEAYAMCKMAQEADSANIDNKVNLAICLIENKGEVMQGVQILLGIVKKTPNHLKANFILGKFAAVSKQWDKSIARLQKVISLDKGYTEAYLELAKAYRGKGQIDLAKKTLIDCKATLKDLEARNEIQVLINNINN